MIIPNRFNGYQPDGTRRYHKGKGGSNKAVKLEQQRIAKMNAAIDAINSIFNQSDRQNLYKEQQSAVFDLNKNTLDQNYSEAERNNRFGLARNGLIGGSADIDANADLQTRYNQGLVDARARGQEAAANLKSADETAKQTLIGLAESGIESGSAANMATSQLASNASAALGERGAATIGNYFNDMAQLYLANKLAGTASPTLASQLYNPYSQYNLGTNDTYAGSNS